jgi:hypothetical protein
LHALTLLIAWQLLSELKEPEGSNIEYFVLPPAAGPKREFVLKSGDGLDGMSAPSLESAQYARRFQREGARKTPS